MPADEDDRLGWAETPEPLPCCRATINTRATTIGGVHVNHDRQVPKFTTITLPAGHGSAGAAAGFHSRSGVAPFSTMEPQPPGGGSKLLAYDCQRPKRAMTDSLTNEDFDDATEVPERGDFHLRDFDLALLTHPVVLRSLVGVAVAIAIVLWPERNDQILARLVGAGAFSLGAVAVWSALRSKPLHRLDLLLGVVGLGLGAVLLAAPPERSAALLGRGLGAAAVFFAARLVIGVLRGGDQPAAWPISQAGLLAGLGGLLIAFPATLLTMVVFIFGVGWAAVGVIAVTMSLDRSTEGVASYADAGHLVVRWLEERPKGADDRQALYAKILYDGPSASGRIIRFFMLMTFASAIASTGVVADSTAVVIGAMLIAPLMTPLMGMSISLVMGWPNRLARSSLIAVAGIGLAIFTGLVIGLVAPAVIDPATNSQIVARASPTTLDLMIAIAAGAAGAYGLSRPDVSDSLPGVAIAISLVPPLTVVGISYSQGAWAQGSGALLLFATNMVAILLVGGLVFVVTGVTPVQRLAENQQRILTSLAAVGAMAALVFGALLLNGAQIARDVTRSSVVEDTAQAWIEPFAVHSLVQIDINDDIVTAVVLGPTTDAPKAAELADMLAAVLDRTIEVRVRLVVEERDTAIGSP